MMIHNLEYLNEYLEYLNIDKKYSNNTILSYHNDLKIYLNFLKEKSVLKVQEKDVQMFLNQERQDKNSRTIAHLLTVLNNFYQFLLKNQYLSKNPVEYIELPKLKKTLPTVLSHKEIESLLDIELVTKYDYRNKAMLELLYSSGLRVSELVNLTVYDVQLSENIVRIIGKGGKERIVPIDLIMQQIIYNLYE